MSDIDTLYRSVKDLPSSHLLGTGIICQNKTVEYRYCQGTQKSRQQRNTVYKSLMNCSPVNCCRDKPMKFNSYRTYKDGYNYPKEPENKDLC